MVHRRHAEEHRRAAAPAPRAARLGGEAPEVPAAAAEPQRAEDARRTPGRPSRGAASWGVEDTGCLVLAGDRLVATLGLEDIVIVDTGDALLVMNKARAQEVKKLMDALRAAGQEPLL